MPSGGAGADGGGGRRTDHAVADIVGRVRPPRRAGPPTSGIVEFRYSGCVISAVAALDVVALGARMREERRRRGFTLETLAAASGVSRSMLSEVERGSRVPTVLVLDRIATAHPALGEHLARTVRTGTVCSYAPDPRLPSSWES